MGNIEQHEVDPLGSDLLCFEIRNCKQEKVDLFVGIRSVGLSEEYNMFVVLIAIMLLTVKNYHIFHH